jgi:vacuolar-type H+-ATPase subunit E/Vma4
MSGSLDRTRETVLRAAAQEAESLRAASRESLRREMERIRTEAQSALARRLGEAEAALGENNRRALAQSRREGRLRVLAARNRAAEEIFARAAREILALPADARRDVLRRWLGEGDANLGGEVLPAAADRPVLAQLVAEATGRFGPAVQLRLSDRDAPFSTGFVLKTDTYEVRRSLEDWLDEKKREIAPELERGAEDKKK